MFTTTAKFTKRSKCVCMRFSIKKQNFDPGYYALKRSIKTFLAISISIFIFRFNSQFAIIAFISTMFLCLSQIGDTLKQRKISMLLTGLIMVLLIPFTTIIGGTLIPATILFTMLVFIAFYFSGVGIIPPQIASFILVLCLITMKMHGNFKLGIIYSGIILSSTLISFIIHFLILPNRPSKIFQTILNIGLKNIDEFNDSIIKEYADKEMAKTIVNLQEEKLVQSINRFRRLFKIIKLIPNPNNDIKPALISVIQNLDRMHESLVTLWQYRLSAWDSDIYKKFIEVFREINPELTTEFHKVLSQSKLEKVSFNNIIKKLDSFKSNVKELKKSENNNIPIYEWILVFNSVFALQTMMKDIVDISNSKDTAFPQLEKKENLSSFLSSFKKVKNGFSFKSPAFRMGLQAAITAGATMFFYKYYNINFGYWIVLFVIMIIKPNLGISVKMGLNRLFGTLIGVLIGVGFILIFKTNTYFFYGIVILALFAMLYMMNLSKILFVYVIMTFLIILLFSELKQISGWQLGLIRFEYTAISVGVAFAATFLLWPNKAGNQLKEMLANGFITEKDIFIKLLSDFIHGSYNKSLIENMRKKLEITIEKAQETYNTAKSEGNKRRINLGCSTILHLKNIQQILLSIDTSAHNVKTDWPQNEIKLELTDIVQSFSESFEILSESISSRIKPKKLPDFEENINKISTTFKKIKYKKEYSENEIFEVRNFSSLLWHLRPLLWEIKAVHTSFSDNYK
ncbi:MAG: FUSC family protein [Bacteroidales bacterium]|nr:FUSC family protein [Bacteroidales bacterium]